MKKRIIIAVLGLVIIIAILAGVKALQIGAMIDQGKKFVPPPETVTTAQVKAETWDTALSAVGTLSAVQGVTVAAELPGKVVSIAFEPGATVKKGDLLVKQDTSSEEAQLPGAVAQVNLTRSNRQRAETLLQDKIISQADYDSATASYVQAVAQADNIRATIAKKSIRAPFGGRLGTRLVNLGQILREGDPVVALQSLDPIYVDFTIPQQELTRLNVGQPVTVTTDALPGESIAGRITTISPQIDADTRAVKLQATVSNKGEKLRSGMYVTVSVGLPVRQKVLVIPATAVMYAPYSDSVFIVEPSQDGKGKALRQQFIRLGEKRGDFVVAATGVKEGEQIVSTGVFKLRTGQAVVVDNKLAPDFKMVPKPENN